VPCLSGIAVLGTCGKDFSFPSDHAVMAGATAAGILLVTRGLLAWVAVLAALALAFSRVYIAAHYPHDVLAGLLLGAAVSVLGYLMVRRVLTRIVVALQGTRMRPMLTAAPAPDGSREPVAGGAG
jgi:membrane-associated phospholipid phosphatase